MRLFCGAMRRRQFCAVCRPDPDPAGLNPESVGSGLDVRSAWRSQICLPTCQVPSDPSSHPQVYPEWQRPLLNLQAAVNKLKEREQRADLKAMANMYGLALDAQMRVPGRHDLCAYTQTVCTISASTCESTSSAFKESRPRRLCREFPLRLLVVALHVHRETQAESS